MILVFGGTLEGRMIADRLSAIGYPMILSVATGYGARSILKSVKNQGFQVIQGELAESSIAEKIDEYRVELIIDATHPFAINLTASAKKTAAAKGVPYLRFKRPDYELPDDKLIVRSSDFERAAASIRQFGQVIFLSIGSKHLRVFVNAKRRDQVIIARVLPTKEAIDNCLRLGIESKNIIAAQGPFSPALNMSFLKEYGASVMVTKNSGVTGGLAAKVEAALALRLPLIVVDRPDAADSGIIEYRELEAKVKEVLG